MYGMVNRAMEQMVCARHGEAVWEEIKRKAGVNVEVFISNEPYPDEVTYRLVAAASEVLGAPAGEILESFGEHWVRVTAHEGYGGLMHAAGRTLPEFLAGLNHLHTRVVMMFPQLKPPRFEVSDVTPDSMRLLYFSDREGLESFVIGLVRGLGTMLGTPAQAMVESGRATSADPVVFRVTWEAAVP